MNTPQIGRSLHVQRFLAGAIGGLAMSSLGLVSVLLGVLGCLVGFALGWFAVDMYNYNWAGLFARRGARSASKSRRSVKQWWHDYWDMDRRHDVVRNTGSVAMCVFVLAVMASIVGAFIVSDTDFADIDAFINDVNDDSRSVVSRAALIMLTIVVGTYSALAALATLIVLSSTPFMLLDGEFFKDQHAGMRDRRIDDLKTLGTVHFALAYWRRCVFFIVGVCLTAIVANVLIPIYFILWLAVMGVSGCGLAVTDGVRAFLDPKRNIVMSVLATLCGGAASLLWLMPRLEGSFAIVLGTCLTGLACGALSMAAPLMVRVKGLPPALGRARVACEEYFDHPNAKIERMTSFMDRFENVPDAYVKRFDLEYLA